MKKISFESTANYRWSEFKPILPKIIVVNKKLLALNHMGIYSHMKDCINGQ